MRLVVDASALVAEVLRARGRALLEHPTLDLVVAADAWSETEHELRKRAALMTQRGFLSEARRRVPRDLRDAPTVAVALALDCGIWTGDYDFFGCGLPVWTTETLQLHLNAQAGA